MKINFITGREMFLIWDSLPVLGDVVFIGCDFLALRTL